MTDCSECSRPAVTRGLCPRHYRRAYRDGSLVIRERLPFDESKAAFLAHAGPRGISAARFGIVLGLSTKAARQRLERLAELGIARRRRRRGRALYGIASSR